MQLLVYVVRELKCTINTEDHDAEESFPPQGGPNTPEKPCETFLTQYTNASEDERQQLLQELMISVLEKV